MGFIPDDAVNKRILTQFVYTYSKSEENPSRVWVYLREQLQSEVFFDYVMVSNGPTRIRYVKRRIVDPDEIREEIGDYVADAYVDYRYWTQQPDEVESEQPA